MLTRWMLVASILFASLMLIPTGAHLLALPNKISMNAADYFVAQQVYRGWAYAGALIVAGIVTTAILSWQVRHSSAMFPPTLVALVCLIAAQVVFWTLVFPGNQQTQNWTVTPANWEELRTRWEIGHALSAVLNVAALVALLVSLLRSDPLLPRAAAPA